MTGKKNYKKPTILIFAHFYLPGTKAGGPIRSIYNLVSSLNPNYNFRIISLDRDFKDKFAYENIKANVWTDFHGAKVYYVGPSFINLISIVKAVKSCDFNMYYLNSFFDPIFSFFPLFFKHIGLIPNRPILLAPRGEFALSALEIKTWKKKPYLFFLKKIGALNNLIWHASNNFEAADIDAAIMNNVTRPSVKIASDLTHYKANIKISNNISTKKLPDEIPKSIGNNNPTLNICFLSRISPMKNLEFALNVLSNAKCEIIFNIHGPKEDMEYWKKCEALLKNMPRNIHINIFDEYKYEDVSEILSKNDLFFLPTLGENFGHVIHEALQSGIPVLISDRTPWIDIEDYGAGWIGSLDNPLFFTTTIENISIMKRAELDSYKLRAFKYANIFNNSNNSLNKNIELFNYVLNHSV